MFLFGSRKSRGSVAPWWTIILFRLRTRRSENAEGAGMHAIKIMVSQTKWLTTFEYIHLYFWNSLTIRFPSIPHYPSNCWKSSWNRNAIVDRVDGYRWQMPFSLLSRQWNLQSIDTSFSTMSIIDWGEESYCFCTGTENSWGVNWRVDRDYMLSPTSPRIYHDGMSSSLGLWWWRRVAP